MNLSKQTLFLFLLLLLFIPSTSFGQNAANKSWQSYWTKFIAAIKNKDLKVLKVLSIQKPFSSGGGIEDTFDEYWQGNKKWRNEVWKSLIKSVNSGTKTYGKIDGKLSRVTKDDELIFVYTKNGWRWWGVMGD